MRINICKKDYGKKEILDISAYDFPTTGVIGLLGINGAGKTTMFRMFGDLIVGEYEGPNKSTFSYFSDDSSFFKGTIMNTLKIINVSYLDFDMKKAQQILLEIGLNVDTMITSLSRGQKVLLNIVLTISRDAKVYLLDEMYSNLDFEIREIITNIFVKYVNTKDKLIIASSHEIHDIERLCDYICILHDKKLSSCRRTEDIITNHKTIYSYFENYITGGNHGV